MAPDAPVRLLRSLLAAGCALALAGCASGLAWQPPAATAEAERSAATAQRHMAAAAHPLAAQTALEILRAGGTALDAAIAAQMVLTLVEPQSSGIGGGAFLLHWNGREVESYDGRETAPAGAHEGLFVGADGKALPFFDAAVGGRAVGVPGVLRMLELAHRQHGRLTWAQLFEPAIALAESGFPLSRRLHAALANDKHLARDEGARAYFYRADAQPKPPGTLLKNPQLAATLRTIARGGADAFYRGSIARDIVAAVRTHATNPGSLAQSDLSGYQAKRRLPICADYRQWRVCGMGPPSSGGIAIAQMLGMFSVRNIAVVPPHSVAGRLEPQPEGVHLFSEVARLAYADRARYVADEDFVPVDVAALTNPDYLSQRARLVTARSMGRADAGALRGKTASWAEDRSPHREATSHLSVVDTFGNAVSMTTSVEDAFGARLFVRGFVLNNQLTDFSFLPREADETGRVRADGALVANRVQGGKRPRSTMAPTLIFDRTTGRLVAAVGSPGGSQIVNYVAKTLVGVLDWKLGIQQAIDLPNFGSRNGPTEIEQGRANETLVAALRARGHEVRLIPMTSGLQGIVRGIEGPGTVWIGGADPRREGVAIGD